MLFFKGMDVSMLKELEARGASYFLHGENRELFSLLRQCGVNLIRLRLWQDPYDEQGIAYGGGQNDMETTIALANRAQENGLPFMLDFHYSDFWADPAKQIKPKSWRNLSGEMLQTAVFLHTTDSLKALKNRGLTPQFVQVGNEISRGFLFPDGRVEQKKTMIDLLKAGIYGVRETCPECRIVLHLDYGTDNNLFRDWFDTAIEYDLDFDVIGTSYYPHYHGDMESLSHNLNDLSTRYGKDIFVVETSIGYTTDTLGCKGITYTKEQEQATGYAATQEGQETFLYDLIHTVRNVENGRGIGVCYWEPEWIAIPDCTWGNENGCSYLHDSVEPGNTNANQALFDAGGNANLALIHLNDM